MNISVFSSKKFLIPLRVMLFSFLKHNNFEKHNIFIVNTELDEKDISKLDSDIYARFGQHITSLKINSDKQRLFHGKTRYREASFYKLYMFRELPIQLDRIMCLDADMVIRGSLKDFYYQKLGDNVLAACKENEEYYDEEHMKLLNIDREEDYFNIGVLLIDLKKFLNSYAAEQYAEWYNRNMDCAIYVAQDIINVFFKNRIKICDNYLFNNQIIYSSNFSPEGMSKMLKEVVVIHYVGPIKPDDYRYECDLRKCYMQILREYGLKKEWYRININRFFRRNSTRFKRLLKRR